jgi:hypothetical protein
VAVALLAEHLDLEAQGLVLPDLLLEKVPRQLGLRGHPRGGEDVKIGQLVLAVPVVLGLDEPLGDQGTQAVVRLPDADPERGGQLALRELRALCDPPDDVKERGVVEEGSYGGGLAGAGLFKP